MSDWIGLGVIVILIVLAIFAMSRPGVPRREMSVEEFEERARTGGHTRAGMFGLQEVLDPKQAKAVAVQKDLKHGYYNKKRVPGDGDDEEGEGEVGATAGSANDREVD
ncbi:MAG: hypothetical protein LC800_05750, partial [Acidobacteria bacterium]|nr:hypothetical protein [Acidobacteriota bacterium]